MKINYVDDVFDGVMVVNDVEPGDIVEGKLVVSVRRSSAYINFIVLRSDNTLERKLCQRWWTVHCVKYRT
jgi:hypothetical protein